MLYNPDPNTDTGEASIDVATFAQRCDVDRLTAEANSLREQLTEKDRQHEEFRQSATDIAARYAHDHGWCSVIDTILDEIGLPPRQRDWTVPVDVTQTVYVRVTATTDSDAESSVELSDVTEAMGEVSWHYASPDYEVGDAEPA
jgi:hypothetical protein